MSSTPRDVPDDVPVNVPGDGRDLDAHALLELVAACHAQIAALRAAQAGAIGALLTRPELTLPPATGPAGDGAGAGAERGEPLVEDLVCELAARLTLTTSAAGTLVSVADQLTRRFPHTLGALAAGRTDHPRARAVVDQCVLLTDDQARYLDQQITHEVTTCTTAALRAHLTNRTNRLDPYAVQRRARRAVTDRSVRYYPLGDGIANLLLRGPATDLRCAYEHLTSLAEDTTRPGATTDPHAALVHDPDGPDTPDGPPPDTSPADQRGLDAKRFDSAVSQLTSPCPTAPGIGAGRGPQIFVHLGTALGLDQTSGELTGHGPLPASHARALLTHHRFRRILTDPATGDVTAVDGHNYPPGTIPDLTRPVPTTSAHAAGAESSSTSADGSAAAQAGAPSAEPIRRPGQRRSRPPAERDARRDPSAGRTTVTPGEVPAPGHPAPRGPAPMPLGAVSVDSGAARTGSTGVGGDRFPGEGVAATAERSDPPLRADPPCPVAAAGGGPYAIPAGTQRLVKVRSRRCMAPGCRTPATRCDSDHVREWPEGPTCPCNLVSLCRRHHDLKTRRGWHLRKSSDDPRDATLTWTTVLGHRYTVQPERLLPEPDPDPSCAPASPPLTDRLTELYDRSYPIDRPPHRAPDASRDTISTAGAPAPNATRQTSAPRRTWADLPDDPPY